MKKVSHYKFFYYIYIYIYIYIYTKWVKQLIIKDTEEQY